MPVNMKYNKAFAFWVEQSIEFNLRAFKEKVHFIQLLENKQKNNCTGLRIT